jgi:hypothetical protein
LYGISLAIWLSIAASSLLAFDAAERRQKAQEFHLRAQEKTGVLVPMYVYPGSIERNPHWNRLFEIKRRFETVPMWVIVNPASGPGKKVDANYTRAIKRLRGAGSIVLGYVSTRYAKRAAAEVEKEIGQWLAMYPEIHGIFFDEMVYEDTEAGASYQAALNQYAKGQGLWPTVANPGANTPGRYFAQDAADVIIIHEGNHWPEEDRLKGDTDGGYSDYPPFTRGVLLHSQEALEKESLQMVRKYARWVYVTEGPYREGDPKASNPWDRVSKHLEELCRELQSEPR